MIFVTLSYNEVIKVTKDKHLIALDLDGTLLRSDQTISPYTKDVLLQLKEDGHVVVIATGRSNRISIKYYKELGLETPLINSNGAHVHHPTNKKWRTRYAPIKHQTAQDIIHMCDEVEPNNILATVYDDVYLERFDQRIYDFFAGKEGDDSFKIGQLKQLLQADPSILMIYPDEVQVPAIMDYISHSPHADIVEHRTWGPPLHVVEVMQRGLNKATALKEVADEYDIKRKHIIAFGDEGNDLEMLDYAGIGVAMGNAVDDAKSVAKVVTDCNESDGIGKMLAEHFNLKIQPETI